jgi:hypothetical protein
MATQKTPFFDWRDTRTWWFWETSAPKYFVLSRKSESVAAGNFLKNHFLPKNRS